MSMNDKSIRSLCINDSPLCPEESFPMMIERITKEFEKKFPMKSSFEI